MGRRTRLAAALVVLLAAPSLAADLDEIQKTGVLRVLVVDGFPVFYSLKPDGPPRLDREILEGFARLQKVKIVTVEAPSWDEDALLLKPADPELQLGLFLGPPQNLALGIRRDSPVLLEALDEHITNVRHSMAWNRLVVRYFGASALEVLREARPE